MRIAHVTATFPPYKGGTGNVCYHNARQLAGLGHDVSVFTAATADMTGHDTTGQFTVHRLPALAQVGNAPLLPQLTWLLRAADIIHLHYPFIAGAEMAAVAAARCRTPLIVTFHNDLIGDGWRAPIFRYYQRLSARLTVQRATRLCAVSLDHYRHSQLHQSLTSKAPPVVELSNGVDVDRFNPVGPADVRSCYGIPDEAKLLLFVAALDRAHHFKGLPLLLRAMQQLPEECWLLVVGDGDLRGRYQDEAARLGLAHRVRFAGGIDHHHLPRFYRSADASVLPSSPPESFGLVVIESMACGTPVLAAAIPGVRTLIEAGQDGLLVKPHDQDDLVRQIRTILSLPQSQLQEMSAAGRRKVEARYSWPQIGRQLEALYCQVNARARN